MALRLLRDDRAMTFADTVQTPYQRFRSLEKKYKFTLPARLVGIVYSSADFAWWRFMHPGASFADYYAGRISRQLDQGGGHPTLGKRQLFPSKPFAPSAPIHIADQRRRGRHEFQFLLRMGLRPEHTCIDYGCGSLRIGQHLIDYLDSRHYWGLDITDRFFRDGRDLLPARQVETKQPSLHVISAENLRQAGLINPDFVISISVLSHVPPAETGPFFDRIVGLMGDKTKLLISFRESTRNFRAAGKGWARDAETVESLIRTRRPESDIVFHREIKKKAGYPQWKTIVVVS
jgi:hypothetical protein